MNTKKHTPVIVHLCLMALFVACIISCTQKDPTPEEVATKIDTKEVLTKADYTTIINYCGEYAKKAQQYFDIINAESNDSTDAATKATDNLANLYASYKYLDSFRTTLASTDLTKLGNENEKKVNEFAKYEAFPLPQGAGANLQNPNVEGMIEDMPQQGSKEAQTVIATSDGEAVK